MTDTILFSWNFKSIGDFEDFGIKNNVYNTTLCSPKKQFYNLLAYNKFFVKNDKENINRFYKSVIVDKKNKVKSIFSPKSIEYNHLVKAIEIIPQDFYVEEFVPGINVSIFYDTQINEWELHSRYNVGCKIYLRGKFSLTLRELFYDICEKIKFDFKKLDKKYVYSFIIQDPYISSIYTFKNIRLYLMDIYQICDYNENNVQLIKKIDIKNFKSYFGFANPSPQIVFPKIILDKIHENKNEMYKLIFEIQNGLVSDNVYGYIIKSRNFPSYSKILNPLYQNKYELYGIPGKTIYNYISIRYLGKLYYYLKHNPEKRHVFGKIRHSLHSISNLLYNHYVNIYINKKYKLTDIKNNHYVDILRKAQDYYLKELLIEKKFFKKKTFNDYINKINPNILIELFL
jgi:hypothetical protein